MNRNGRTLASMAGKLLATAAPVLAVAAVLVAQAPSAYAGADQVYGTMFAWDNNFNDSDIGVSFGSGSLPNMTFWYDFTSDSLYGYPACIQGWHYGWNPANSTKYPAKISSIGSDPATFDFSYGGSDMHGDFTYDMFLRSDDDKSTPELEVMVWGFNNSYPIGSKVASNTVNGQDLWMGYNSSAGYETFSFVPAGTGGGAAYPSSGSGSININVGSYLTYLTAHYGSYVNSNWYLDVVEAGEEVVEGNGWVWVEASN